MRYKVLDTHPVGSNTAVTIRGDGADITPGCEITDEDNIHFKVLEIAKDPLNFIDHVEPTRILTIQGAFYSRRVVTDAIESRGSFFSGTGAFSALMKHLSETDSDKED
ncbi:hypothetical protein [Eubacterium oxidoreducens]|uniref:Uncharacterized protein n=1 Tax=Eubacterium oxidoreducens TaxID=1732 RepID=A0A1G6AEE0_EUBOX|nr:hypothetical protein [Eubacterium oxidoreducens]SDB06690.1 hypothetical protein SAMN02910417_00475 [Eubacterium oxidoreducens]